MKRKYVIIIFIIVISLMLIDYIFFNESDAKQTSGSIVETMSNQKIEWGIKRNNNHNQPDLGSKNKKIIDENNGIAMGNKESKNVYLTFDEGYEAGYTEKILETLKQNNVKAAFFITAHYVNTNPDLVQKMIDEGHIVGNHTPKYLMLNNYKTIKI